MNGIFPKDPNMKQPQEMHPGAASVIGCFLGMMRVRTALGIDYADVTECLIPVYEAQVVRILISWYAFFRKEVESMNTYVTGTTIRQLREARNMTQSELGARIGVSSKTVSKWETAKGLPDIGLLQPLAQALGISVIELMNGEHIINRNVSANMLRSQFYVCPICGNAVHALGNAVVSCCGITLPALEAEEPEDAHAITIENVEDEHFITIYHPMTKAHYISFVAFVTSDRIQMVKLYPEGNAQTRIQLRGMGYLYYYCNRHGLFRRKISKTGEDSPLL